MTLVRSLTRFGLPVVLALVPCFAVADPTLYHEPFHQSPVRGAAGDSLMIPGEGFQSGDAVAYRRLTGCGSNCCPPLTSIPTSSNANCGTTTRLGQHAQALNVKLPSVFVDDETYSLRVFRSNSPVGEEIKINDARPKWASPSRVYQTANVPGTSGRVLKVIGRNLQPTPTPTNNQTQIRLMDGSTVVVSPLNATLDTLHAAMNHYVAKVTLPSITCPSPGPPCALTVQASRDGGTTWVSAPYDYKIWVDPDPPTQGVGRVLASTHCGTTPPADCTACLQAAIDAAHASYPNGGTVELQSATYVLQGGTNHDSTGIVLPANVHLLGKGTTLTTIKRASSWDTPAVFTISEGPNRIEKIRFDDDHANAVFPCAANECTVFVALKNPSSPSGSIHDVTIVGNLFVDMAHVAVGDLPFGPLTHPVQRLYIVDNEFESHFVSIALIGNSTPTDSDGSATFVGPRIEDSIITLNDFHPRASSAGVESWDHAFATAFGTAVRLDFSENYFHAESIDHSHKGWRAHSFWHLINSHEDVLISRNTGECPGRYGEGEFLSFDANAGVPGFPTMLPVTSADTSSVVVSGQPQFEEGYWVQVVKGKGLGQTRRITGCTCTGCTFPDCTASSSGSVTIDVTPPWDVKPDSCGSYVTVMREYARIDVVANSVDSTKSDTGLDCPDNGDSKKSGAILLFGTTSDWAIERNTQTESDGIGIMAQSCTPPSCSSPAITLHYFDEFRGNVIDREYDFSSSYSWSGINLAYGLIYDPAPVLGYGVSAGRNTINQADGVRGGGIGLANLSYTLPTPGTPVFRNFVLHNNSISHVKRGTCPSGAFDCDNYPSSGSQAPDGGIGIYIQEAYSHQTVVRDNTFTDNCADLLDFGAYTFFPRSGVSSCPATSACDCSGGCSPNQSCSDANQGVATCQVAAGGPYFSCPVCSDAAAQTIHVEQCGCSGGGSCSSQQQKDLFCKVP